MSGHPCRHLLRQKADNIQSYANLGPPLSWNTAPILVWSAQAWFFRIDLCQRAGRGSKPARTKQVSHFHARL